MNGELGLLLNIHDGDDRCGCLRHIIDVWVEGTTLGISIDDLYGASVVSLLACLEHHPAGSLYRSLERSVGPIALPARTDVRTDGLT